MRTARLAFALVLAAALLGGCFRAAHPGGSTADSTGAAPIPSLLPSDTTSEPPATGTSGGADTAQPESPPADTDSYFENALFLGDSVMESVSRYVRARRGKGESVLADARFLTDVSGIRIADLVGDTDEEDRIRYQYKGKAQELPDILADMQPSRIFLSLGMNDLSFGYSTEDTVARYERLLLLLQEACPDVPLVVLTVTPKTDSQYLPWYCRNKSFGSALLNEFAQAQLAFCAEREVDCVDVNAVLRDESGNLPAAYSNDGYIHLNDDGAALVIGALEDYALREGNDS